LCKPLLDKAFRSAETDTPGLAASLDAHHAAWLSAVFLAGMTDAIPSGSGE